MDGWSIKAFHVPNKIEHYQGSVVIPEKKTQKIMSPKNRLNRMAMCLERYEISKDFLIAIKSR